MNKNVIILIILIVAIAGTLFTVQQNERAAQQREAQLQAAEEANQLAAEAQKAINEAKRLEELARKEAEAFRNEMATYVADARTFLDSGEYQKAIDTAKNILSRDAENASAKLILQTAISKLKEIAQKEINTLTKQEPKKVIEDADLVPSIPAK